MDPGSSVFQRETRVITLWRSRVIITTLDQEIMKYTTVKISEILKHPTMRLDAKYWIKKKIKKAASRKLQATSSLTTVIR